MSRCIVPHVVAFPDLTATVNKWQAGAGAAQASYVDGINRTTKDPTALAAAQAQKMLSGVTQAVTSGYWQRRLADTGKAGWQSASVAKAANYGVGVQAAGDKYRAGVQAFWSYMGPTLSAIENMPKNTLADSIARASAWITASSQYQKP